jgi:hypothetical protein
MEMLTTRIFMAHLLPGLGGIWRQRRDRYTHRQTGRRQQKSVSFHATLKPRPKVETSFLVQIQPLVGQLSRRLRHEPIATVAGRASRAALTSRMNFSSKTGRTAAILSSAIGTARSK